MMLSDAEFISSISKIFDLSGPFPLHSLLSEAASEILSPSALTFRGFRSFEEKLYIILIVALFSTATVFAVVTISVCCEDKVMKMADKRTELKFEACKKGPSLLTPIPEKKLRSSYSTFHQLKKRHMQDTQATSTTNRETLLVDKEADQRASVKYARLSDPGSPVLNTPVLNSGLYGADSPTANAVTYSEITLADLTTES